MQQPRMGGVTRPCEPPRAPRRITGGGWRISIQAHRIAYLGKTPSSPWQQGAATQAFVWHGSPPNCDHMPCQRIDCSGGRQAAHGTWIALVTPTRGGAPVASESQKTVRRNLSGTKSSDRTSLRSRKDACRAVPADGGLGPPLVLPPSDTVLPTHHVGSSTPFCTPAADAHPRISIALPRKATDGGILGALVTRLVSDYRYCFGAR